MTRERVLKSRRMLFMISMLVGLLATASRPARACDFCILGNSPLSGLGPNVYWTFVDSIAACPASDSLQINDTAHRHPSKLRIEVWYDDANCQPKVGVPPESLWVTWSTASGNAKINDESSTISADDSTDACGHTRFTIPSLSGCGKLSVRVTVAGRSQGNKNIVVRTVDVDASGRVDLPDIFNSTCDVNYDGTVDSHDDLLAQHHEPDWHRNTLFGTLVRRTNVCDTCSQGQPNTLGESVNWAPHGKTTVISIFDQSSDCALFLVPADVSTGNIPTQFTFPPTNEHDYDGSWAPDGTFIVWDRHDFDFYTKGVPGHNQDTQEHEISITSGLVKRTEISLSPDGNTIAFSGFYIGGTMHVFTLPITGGVPTTLTSDTLIADDFPQWSPDGNTIIFQRQLQNGDLRLCEIPSKGGSPRLLAPIETTSLTPVYSADGAVLAYQRGLSHPVVATLDTTVALGPLAIVNYSEFTTGLPLAKLSPDGTRIALQAIPPAYPTQRAQFWVTRRNMSLPPQFTSFGAQQLADSTMAIQANVIQGLNYSASVSASDPEGDALTYEAFYLQLGMSFDPSTRTFSWTPPAGTVGHLYTVKFRVKTSSGGTDAFIAQFKVVQSLRPERATQVAAMWRVKSANPVFQQFIVEAPPGSGPVSLEVFDAGGRRVASVRQTRGRTLSWDLHLPLGKPAPEGVYFYRAHGHDQEITGKIIIAH
jgi:hypothetical protein